MAERGERDQDEKLEFTAKLMGQFFELFPKAESEKIDRIFKDVTAQYNGRDRFYHNLDHVSRFLEFLAARKNDVSDYQSVRLAAWFHDLVYDPKSNDNEEQSALYAHQAMRILKLPTETIQKVESLILATKNHEPVPDDPDSSIFLDGDTTILGASEAEYDKYAKAIKQERHWIPEGEYKQRRKEFLENILKRERIYFTDEAFQKFEQRARGNIKREIDSLK